LLGASVILLCACGNPLPGSGGAEPTAQAAPATAEQLLAASERVTPPFAVRDQAEGLLLVWYDAKGVAHPARSRSDIPEDRRAAVRVDSLDTPPDKRLDPAFVYVADLRAPEADGSYAVRKVAREALEAAFAKPPSVDEPPAVAQSDDVIIYGASWCGACRQAAGYFRQKGVPFVEKDIEKEPQARGEMLAKAKAQGVNTRGIPVIDVYGTLLGGFDPRRIDQLLARK
jgi:glutaredoxin